MVFTRQRGSSDYTYCTDTSGACTCGGSVTGIPNSFYGETDATFSQITLEDTLLCTKVVMTRVVPQTPGAFYLNFSQVHKLGADPCGVFAK